MKKIFWKSDWFSGLIIPVDFHFSINSPSQKSLANNVFLKHVGHCLKQLISYFSIFEVILTPRKLISSSYSLKFQHKCYKKDQELSTQFKTCLELAS